METRSFGLVDRVFGEIDKAIKVLSAPARSVRPPPAAPEAQILAEAERAESARLMRVNHAGEVAAQALYRGQALTARDAALSGALRHAAAEENDHLAWCELRLRELHGRTSVLNPLWYAGSFAIGALAGAFGRSISLGFVAETERQVESHLRSHIKRLSTADHRSRAILEQMTHDEMQHGAEAATLGGKELPLPAGVAMRWTARIMTLGSYWL
ncbi:MAG TPA: 2-polyprenyl-3-methyl-6-methoxy-1,4-benzoquinone monooxygenase [Steroidobacteraceae bacterium]|jgi:ubiquinone biosynthesis monooxygenase Coq7|nr:2-polyprenyl-3-methyl-6-methoxy-1,4-benzoquinone monooxygenase [Steroidobacteraceae bacterium]